MQSMALDSKDNLYVGYWCVDSDAERMVINGMEWIEELDWKAYAMAFRAHALGHAAQIRAILAELSSGEVEEEKKRGAAGGK